MYGELKDVKTIEAHVEKIYSKNSANTHSLIEAPKLGQHRLIMKVF